jgi:hypothetical protein
MPPEYTNRYPQLSLLTADQKKYYLSIEKKFFDGKYVDVGDYDCYVILGLGRIVQCHKQLGFEKIKNLLEAHKNNYSNKPILIALCDEWIGDCLIASNQFEEYLNVSRPKLFDKRDRKKTNKRLNVAFHCGKKADPIDLLHLTKRKTRRPLIAHYEDRILATAENIFSEYVEENGEWFDLLQRWRVIRLDRDVQKSELFIGACLNYREIETPYRRYAFDKQDYFDYKYINLFDNLLCEAENRVRDSINIPRIGEGWIEETHLVNFLRSELPSIEIKQHGKPAFLGKQHYDIWLPEFKIAVEYHGLQHFEPVSHFGGPSALELTKSRDQRKVNISNENGVKLIVVSEGYCSKSLVELIRQYIAEAQRK